MPRCMLPAATRPLPACPTLPLAGASSALGGTAHGRDSETTDIDHVLYRTVPVPLAHVQGWITDLGIKCGRGQLLPPMNERLGQALADELQQHTPPWLPIFNEHAKRCSGHRGRDLGAVLATHTHTGNNLGL